MFTDVRLIGETATEYVVELLANGQVQTVRKDEYHLCLVAINPGPVDRLVFQPPQGLRNGEPPARPQPREPFDKG